MPTAPEGKDVLTEKSLNKIENDCFTLFSFITISTFFPSGLNDERQRYFTGSFLKVKTATNFDSASPTLTSNTVAGNQWYLNGVAITAATEQALTVADKGIYKVRVKVDDCISEFSATDWFTISFGPQGGKNEVLIYDLTGRQILSHEVFKKEVRLNVADFSGGIYIVKMISAGAIKVSKFEKR